MTPDDIDTIEEPRLYEFCILYPYPMGQKEEAALLKEVERLLEEAGGKQINKDAWGRRGLAYPIGGQTEGTFVIYYYKLDPVHIKELDRLLRITKGILRHMIVKPPKDYQIVPYAQRLEEWAKEKEAAEEAQSRAKEEKLKKQVAEKAKRQVKRTEERKKTDAPTKPALRGEDLNAELEKLISDDDLTL